MKTLGVAFAASAAVLAWLCMLAGFCLSAFGAVQSAWSAVVSGSVMLFCGFSVTVAFIVAMAISKVQRSDTSVSTLADIVEAARKRRAN